MIQEKRNQAYVSKKPQSGVDAAIAKLKELKLDADAKRKVRMNLDSPKPEPGCSLFGATHVSKDSKLEGRGHGALDCPFNSTPAMLGGFANVRLRCPHG